MHVPNNATTAENAVLFIDTPNPLGRSARDDCLAGSFPSHVVLERP